MLLAAPGTERRDFIVGAERCSDFMMGIGEDNSCDLSCFALSLNTLPI
jgi:hypothetical protein